MKISGLIFYLTITMSSYSQINIKEQYFKADSLRKSGNLEAAYPIYKDIKSKCEKNDSLYEPITGGYLFTSNTLVSHFFRKADWKNTLTYSLEGSDIIEESKDMLGANYPDMKFLMIKNIIVSYFGLEQMDKAKIYQDKLYAAYKEKTIPAIVDDYYNFEFFKFENKNVWGYEWYDESTNPDPIEKDSKIIYYVYSTNPDGTDKDQLYRLLVYKSHGIDRPTNSDYVLLKVYPTDTSGNGRELNAYTYNKPIDYIKLRADIRKVLKGN